MKYTEAQWNAAARGYAPARERVQATVAAQKALALVRTKMWTVRSLRDARPIATYCCQFLAWWHVHVFSGRYYHKGF